ncbi:hypothetical protein G6F37_004691 [Rhizopus arrhizus]|nr:hypothetical protein G6F38_004777 [Rhizopus arrhizus]KAG1159664.1 hypothetical protein G6F37_004691 [Rhizopus arrhizus]
MEELYSENDPSYSQTRVPSGIAPPTLRDLRRADDLSSYNPATLRMTHNKNRDQRYQPYSLHDSRPPREYRPSPDSRQPYDSRASHDSRPSYDTRSAPPSQQQAAYKPKPLDLKPRVDFLKCQKRLLIEELASLIRLKDTVIDYDFLCSKASVDKVYQLKERIQCAPKELVSQARSKSNPFERIGNSIFMNRAAVKLAAIDADFGLTVTKNDEPLKFLDICGGPGGFSEYLIWRIYSWGQTCQGYGITLKMPKEKDEMNWHVEKFREDIPKDRLTIIHGQDSTGDVYKLENIKQVESIIKQEAEGVDLAVADGGFDFSGQEGQQEKVAQKLLLCEVITMLSTLKKGGNFVCKFFDMLTPFTINLVWLLYQLFDEICITKPFSSRPANSERYVVCRSLTVAHPTDLIDKLSSILTHMDNDSDQQFIPRAILEDDEDFIDYVRMRNFRFITQQIESLEEFNMFIQNPYAIESFL